MALRVELYVSRDNWSLNEMPSRFYKATELLNVGENDVFIRKIVVHTSTIVPLSPFQ